MKNVQISEELFVTIMRYFMLEQAKQMLRELAETSNAVQSNEVFEMADEQGISKRTLENAKKELGIRAKKINNSWYWELDKVKSD